MKDVLELAQRVLGLKVKGLFSGILFAAPVQSREVGQELLCGGGEPLPWCRPVYFVKLWPGAGKRFAWVGQENIPFVSKNCTMCEIIYTLRSEITIRRNCKIERPYSLEQT